IDTDEDIYATLEKQSDGTIKRKTTRFFPEDKFVMYAASANGSFGIGLWGVTPEELSYGPWSDKSAQQFVTLTQWETPDPVALWTKASGLFVPVLPNPEGLIIASITLDGTSGLDTLTVTSIAGTETGDTKVTVTPEIESGHVYKYKTAADCKLPEYGANVRTWASWDGTSDITATTGNEILIVEADANYRAVKAGITTVTSKDS